MHTALPVSLQAEYMQTQMHSRDTVAATPSRLPVDVQVMLKLVAVPGSDGQGVVSVHVGGLFSGLQRSYKASMRPSGDRVERCHEPWAIQVGCNAALPPCKLRDAWFTSTDDQGELDVGMKISTTSGPQTLRKTERTVSCKAQG